MPRLSNRLYLNRHNFLRKLWLEAQGAFGFLHYNQQSDLHSYYLPDEDLSQEQLLAHRQRMSKLDPSLASRAGKAFMRLWSRLQQEAEKPKKARGTKRDKQTVRPHGHRQVTVRGIARPKPDLELLARALTMLAAQKNSEKKKAA